MIARENSISESFSIREIKDLMGPNSWLLLDLDNTTFVPLTALGRDEWFVKLMQYACEIIPDHTEAAIAVLVIYNEVHRYIKMRAVEAEIVDIIREYQNIGRPVIGVTARGEELKEVTIRQLQEIGIDFNGKIIFCGGQDKGICFKAFLGKANEFPSDVVMVDDKRKHLEHVRDVLMSLGINFVGLRYGFLDETVKMFEMEPAQAELIEVKDKLSETANLSINKLKIVSPLMAHSIYSYEGNHKKINNDNLLPENTTSKRFN